MRRKKRKKGPRATPFNSKAGLSPGTPVFIGERKQARTQMAVLRYDEDGVYEKSDATLSDCMMPLDATGVTWINVFGIHDVDFIGALGEQFGIHPLTLEDIVNTTQRPKTEEFENYLFFVLKMMNYNETHNEIEIETVSMVLGQGYVISFQERAGDAFATVGERIRAGKGRIRRLNADYLAYSLMDAVVDAYFVVLEHIGDHIELIEDEIVSAPVPAHMHEIHHLKREILYLRKSVWPLREEISALLKTESSLIDAGTRVYLRDIYDHTIRVIDMVETNRDILASMHDTYLTSVSNRMNEVMKVLTIIATIFIPLTFIVGVYGMNFEDMPELHWRWGYFAVWVFMAAVTGGMIFYFKKKRWLG